MAESALDGSALGRVRGVTPPFLSQQLILGTLQKVNRGFCPVKTPNENYVPPRASKHAPRGTESSLDFHAEQKPQSIILRNVYPPKRPPHVERPFTRSFLLIVTQNLFQHIHRRAANRISLSGIEKIAYLDFRPNAHGAIAYIARMF